MTLETIEGWYGMDAVAGAQVVSEGTRAQVTALNTESKLAPCHS